MIEVKQVSTIVDGKKETRILIKLPEYKQEIIVLEKYVVELKKQLEIITK